MSLPLTSPPELAESNNNSWENGNNVDATHEAWTQRESLQLKMEKERYEKPSSNLPEEFEACDEMKVTTAATKCLPSRMPDLVIQSITLIASRRGAMPISRQKYYLPEPILSTNYD